MEQEHNHTTEYQIEEQTPKTKATGNAILIGSGIIAAGLVISTLIYVGAASRPSRVAISQATGAAPGNQTVSALQEAVVPSGGTMLPVTWGSLGQQMVKAGVIDETQFKALYAQRGGLPQDMAQMLDGSNNGQIKMTPQNAGIILNMLWALGLGNKNPILENGPMQDPQYGGAGRFASTGGWTISVGNAMNHYDAHQFVTLTADQQALVEKVAKNIYRPCCGNSTYFPDCNHGMAMLGLLELMASQGASEDQMYQTALAVNSYWFPDTYLTIAKYFASKGTTWDAVDPKTVLGAAYSSAQGYQQILAQTQPVQSQSSGGGCGVQ